MVGGRVVVSNLTQCVSDIYSTLICAFCGCACSIEIHTSRWESSMSSVRKVFSLKFEPAKKKRAESLHNELLVLTIKLFHKTQKWTQTSNHFSVWWIYTNYFQFRGIPIPNFYTLGDEWISKMRKPRSPNCLFHSWHLIFLPLWELELWTMKVIWTKVIGKSSLVTANSWGMVASRLFPLTNQLKPVTAHNQL